MKLTAYRGKPQRTAVRRSPTTTPGWVNARGQEVVGSTGARSTTRDDQVVYRVRCRGCGAEYGVNGCDLKARKCPSCQGGASGEPLVERALELFG